MSDIGQQNKSAGIRPLVLVGSCNFVVHENDVGLAVLAALKQAWCCSCKGPHGRVAGGCPVMCHMRRGLHSLCSGKLWHGLQLETKGAEAQEPQSGQQAYLRLSGLRAKAPHAVQQRPLHVEVVLEAAERRLLTC